MTRQPGIWSIGLLGSALAHLAIGAALVVALRPEKLADQPSPQSDLHLQAYRVPRSEAVPQQPKGEAAAESKAHSDGLAAAAMPRSQAQPLTPQPRKIASTTPPSAALRPRSEPPPQLSATAMVMPTTRPTPAIATVATSAVTDVTTAAPIQPPLQALAAAQALSSMASSVSAQAVPIGASPAIAAPAILLQRQPMALSAKPAVTAITTAVVPPQQQLPVTRPNAQPSPTQAPKVTPVDQLPPFPIAARLSLPEVPRIKAALAFSGAGADQIDPVSLAAFQNFMQPDDRASSGDTLRDGVSGILAAVPCSRLQVLFYPDTATLSLRGHVPQDGLRAPVLAALQAQMGADITLSDQMKILPRPQCGALTAIAGVGLPQSTDQITNPLLIGADAHARVLGYTGGEQLFFDLTAPDYAAYVYVDYFDAGGAVLHLSPNDRIPLELSPPQSRLRVGAKDANDSGLQITVGPPYGQEIAVAFAASQRLYQGSRPLIEEAAPYLQWLTDRVTEARAADPNFKGEWVYFFVSTAAQ